MLTEDPIEHAKQNGIGLRDLPAAIRFNANPPSLGEISEAPKSLSSVPGPLYADTIGTTLDFKNESSSDLIAAELRHQIVADSRTLNLWVADDSWEPCSKTNCITLAMLTAFGEKFLKSGSNNDIWDWVSNIYGDPWGSHSFSDLLDSSASTQIDILFFDISDDNSTTGGILGFFWAKDNFKASSVSYSNQRLMFYIDSVLTATEAPEGDSWEITDKWPAEMISTLAHEFQHMIHFYQKTVTLTGGLGTETWLNEMASMAAEDLIADKIGVDGPRGVDSTDDTAGSAGNINGRLPEFNEYNYLSVTAWYNGSLVLASYALNYSLGAYLTRNFGGAELMQKIVQNSKTGSDAIDQALSDLGSTETFASVLKKWGVSVLLSDLTTNDAGYRYNTGANITSILGSISYNLGSINLFNYDYGSQSGPRLFSPSSLAVQGVHSSTSNTFVLAGENLTGDFESRVEMPAGLTLSVVTKNSN